MSAGLRSFDKALVVFSQFSLRQSYPKIAEMSLEDNHKYSQLRLLKPEYDGFSSDERIDSSSASENDLIEKNQPSELQPRRKYSILALIVANVVLCMVSIAMLSVGLRLQANGARRCLSLHSTPCMPQPI